MGALGPAFPEPPRQTSAPSRAAPNLPGHRVSSSRNQGRCWLPHAAQRVRGFARTNPISRRRDAPITSPDRDAEVRLPEPDAPAQRLPASPGGHAPERATATRLRPRAQRLRVTLRSGTLRVQLERFGTKGGESSNCALTVKPSSWISEIKNKSFEHPPLANPIGSLN